MKWSEMRQVSLEGQKEAERLGLTDQANWTPLLVYLHVSRLTIGFVLGVVFGGLVATGVCVLVLMAW